MNRWMLGLLGFAVSLVLGVSQAWAVSLGKIEVTSHLGETFFAEVTMQMEEDESISNMFVSLAPPADYRVLEVYHDPALDTIRSDVKNDSRGIRIELSSDSIIDAPFFNLILKVRKGHATHFKKYAVFLDLPQAKPAKVKSLPVISAVQPQSRTGQKSQSEEKPVAATASAVKAEPDRAKGSTTPTFKPYDGWARAGRYGPIVYGDSVGTVASRLRIDRRYPLQQVMMALFNKNKDKFSQGNVNLIHAGAYLDVPTASEVEAISPSQAKALLAKHNNRWNALKKQPRYAAVAKAQKNRYKPRVSVGKHASGVASTSVSDTETKGTAKISKAENSADSAPAGETTSSSVQSTKQTVLQTNDALQEKLNIADARIAALSDKLASADVVVAKSRIKKLELRLARLQAELDRNRQETQSRGTTPFQWLTYLLAGLIVLLLGAVGYLLRRERPHPAVTSMATSAATFDSSPVSPQEDAVQDLEEQVIQQEFVEEPEQTTAQMDTQEPEELKDDSTDTDTSEELPKSDTIEPEAPHDAVEDESEPNIDHITEADVYLRYGMEDEAIEQLEVAIKLQPDNTEAHIKLIQTLQSKGDQARLDAAMDAGRAALSGEGLQALEALITAKDTKNAEVDLGDTLPSTGVEALDSPVTEPPEEETSEENGDSEADSALEISDFDIGDIEWNVQPVGSEEGKQDADVEPTDQDTDESDDGLELSPDTIQSEEPDTSEKVLPEITLDLSDIDISNVGSVAENDSNVEASVPDSSITIDLSMEADALENITGDLSLEETTTSDVSGESEPTIASEQPAHEEEEVVAGLDDLLAGLDMDIEETPDTDASPDSLNIDKARSLLAEGALDDAESSFKTAMEADNKQGDGLIGLAEIAQQRGDTAKAHEFLAEAEVLVDDSNREWFESIKNKQA